VATLMVAVVTGTLCGLDSPPVPEVLRHGR
jgi:hypothetical protein